MNLPAKPTTSGKLPTARAVELFRPQRLLILALMVLAAVGFYQLWAARVERTLLVAQTQLIDCEKTLQATLSSATAQLDLLRVSIEQDLSDPLQRPRQPLASWLEPVPGRAAFAGTSPRLSPDAPVSNITLGAPLPAGADERAREAAAAAELTPLFAAVKKNLVNAAWVYYYSQNGLLAIYPYEQGSIVWADGLLEKEIVVNAAPGRNPSRGCYWSNVYADSAGKGLMSSVVNPVYDREGRFRGIVGFDFTIDSLITYFKGEELAIGTPLIVNKAGQLLAHPSLVRSADREVRTLEDALPPQLRPVAKRLLELPPGGFAVVGDAYVAALDLGATPWRMLFVVDRQRLGLSVLGDMYFELAGMGFLLLALLFFLKNVRLTEELSRLAVTDPLSGLANRRHFMVVLQGEIERTRRSGVPFSLLMLDIDHFKRVNDTYGHNVGDKVIVALAKALSAGVREIDTVGRLGGEEFGVIMPATELSGAVVAAERIRRSVEGMAMTDEGGAVFRVTVSIGAAERDGEETGPEELLRRADSALYSSKNNGRNRVTPYSER